jgi:hypothetical protein
MTIDELIAELRERNTGAPADVVLTLDGEEYWEVALGFSRIGTKGEEPYKNDDDFPMSLVLHPKSRPL